MRRALFTILAAGSTLLCAGACVLWVRSYWVGDLAAWTRPRTEVQVGVARGEAWAYWAHEPAGAARGNVGVQTFHSDPPIRPREWGYGPTVLPYHFDVAGFAVGFGPYTTVPGRTAGVVILPCWAVALLSLAPPVWWVRRRRQLEARATVGLCPACGYDLRATPDRCPECGAVAAKLLC